MGTPKIEGFGLLFDCLFVFGLFDLVLNPDPGFGLRPSVKLGFRSGVSLVSVRLSCPAYRPNWLSSESSLHRDKRVGRRIVRMKIKKSMENVGGRECRFGVIRLYGSGELIVYFGSRSW